MDKAFKNIAIYVLIVMLALFAIKLTSNVESPAAELSYPDFYTKVQQGQVASAQIIINDLIYNIKGTLKDGSKFLTTAPKESDIIQIMQANKVDFTTEPEPPPPWWTALLTTLFPIIILIAFLMFIMNQSQGGGEGNAIW